MTMNPLDDLLAQIAVEHDGYRTTTDLNAALEIAMLEERTRTPRFRVLVTLRALSSDTLRAKLDAVADAAQHMRQGWNRPHDAPCRPGWGGGCDDCHTINADHLSDAIRDLRALLGDRLNDLDMVTA